MSDCLNLGLYDITNDLPIDIKCYGNKNKNKEVFVATDYIKNNINKFKDAIIVVDRAYFSYDFMDFLIKNNLKFIIRAKGC